MSCRGKKGASPKQSSSKESNATTKTVTQQVTEAITDNQDDSNSDGEMLLYSPGHPSSPVMISPEDDELLDSPNDSVNL